MEKYEVKLTLGHEVDCTVFLVGEKGLDHSEQTKRAMQKLEMMIEYKKMKIKEIDNI